MADVEKARTFLAAAYEDAGLPHVAALIREGVSPMANGPFINAVAAALAEPCAHCTAGQESNHG